MPALVAEPPQRLDVGRHPALVDDDDGAGALGEDRLHRPHAEVPVLGLDVGEHRRGPDVHGAVGGRDERERRHDDLVAGPDAEQVQRQVQGGRARRDRDAVRGADAVGEARLELGDPRPLGDPPGAHGVRGGLPPPPRPARAS